MSADDRLQGIGPVLVAVVREEDDVRLLTGMPDDPVWGLGRQPQPRARLALEVEGQPHLPPGVTVQPAEKHFPVPLDVRVREDPLHSPFSRAARRRSAQRASYLA